MKRKNKTQLIYLRHAISSIEMKRVKDTIKLQVTVSGACIHTHTDKQINDNLDTLHYSKCTHFCFGNRIKWSATSGEKDFFAFALVLCVTNFLTLKCYVYSLSFSNGLKCVLFEFFCFCLKFLVCLYVNLACCLPK